MHDTTLLATALDSYFRLNPRVRCEQTRRQYRFALNDFAAGFDRPPTVADLSDDAIAEMMGRLTARGLAPKTINERRGRINCFWSWLAKRGVVKLWPTVPRIPEPSRTPRAWSADDLQRLFAALAMVKGKVGGVPAGLWWRSLHLVAWDGGERISALLACRWEYLTAGWLLVPAEVRKGKRKDASYRLAEDTLGCLEALRTFSRGAEIWPWPYSREYIWIRYREIRRRAGLPVDRRSSFHRMRRSVASHLEAAGGDATAALGHESRRITQSYLDPLIVKPPQATDLLFRPEAG